MTHATSFQEIALKSVWMVIKVLVDQYFGMYNMAIYLLPLPYVADTKKDLSDSERGNPLLSLKGLLFLISSNGYFICTIRQT